MGKGGPKTAAGKALAARNAMSHGLLSPAPVVLATERAEDWQTHLQGVVRSLNAEGHIETALAERVALLLWRLGRVARYESESIQSSQEAVEDDVTKRRVEAATFAERHAPQSPEAVRDEVEYRKTVVAALRRFPKLPDERLLSDKDAVSVLMAAAEQAGVELDEFPLPGVPEDTNWDEMSGWFVGEIRAGVKTMAAHAGKTPSVLLATALGKATTEVAKAEAVLEKVEREVAHLHRERLLPGDVTLGKIARYEAHLSRQLTIALHELEAIQARRAGQPAPLARIDITGGVQEA